MAFKLFCDQNVLSFSSSFPLLPVLFILDLFQRRPQHETKKVDVAVIEVGVGGRTDATNVLPETVVCGMSSIGYDHTNVLGPTLTDIAFEKSGIFKEKSVAFTVMQTEEAMQMILQQSISKQTESLFLTPPLPEFETLLGHPIGLGLKGEHQKINASLALCLSRTFLSKTNRIPFDPSPPSSSSSSPVAIPSFPVFLPSDQMLQGLLETSFAGRNQIIDLAAHSTSPEMQRVKLFVDGAHTTESIDTTVKWFIEETSRAHRTQALDPDDQDVFVLIFSCTHDRKPESLFAPLIDLHASRREGFFRLAIFTPVTLEKAPQGPSLKPPTWSACWTSLLDSSSLPTSDCFVSEFVLSSSFALFCFSALI